MESQARIQGEPGPNAAKSALIVPSNNIDRVAEFIEAWKPFRDWDAMYLIEDAAVRSETPDGVDYHFAWNDIEAALGDAHWCISRRDSAIRSFGFLAAYRAKFEFIATLDDDCHPIGSSGFIGSHATALRGAPLWTPSVPGYRTRGMPYLGAGIHPVALNMGLWAGIPDLDSIQALSGASIPLSAIHPPGHGTPHGSHLEPSNRVIPHGQFFPLCGMNLAFRREFAPLMYFGLQGDGYPYRRFDDIWCGLWAKKCLDQLGEWVTVGSPLIDHQRASAPMVNLVKEAPGIAHHEQFWQTINAADLSGCRIPVECMRQVGHHLAQQAGYVSKLGHAIQVWTDLF